MGIRGLQTFILKKNYWQEVDINVAIDEWKRYVRSVAESSREIELVCSQSKAGNIFAEKIQIRSRLLYLTVEISVSKMPCVYQKDIISAEN